MRNGVEYLDSHRLPVSIVGMSGRRGGRPSARLMYNEQKSIIDDLVPLWNVFIPLYLQGQLLAQSVSYPLTLA